MGEGRLVLDDLLSVTARGGGRLGAIYGIRQLLLLTKTALMGRNASGAGVSLNGDGDLRRLGQHTNRLLEAQRIAFSREVFIAPKPARHQIDQPQDCGERQKSPAA